MRSRHLFTLLPMRVAFTLAMLLPALPGGHGQAVSASDGPEAPVSYAGVPMRLAIPAIGVNTPVEAVGLTPAGLMDVPQRFDDVGWYQYGPRPGELGNAVIAGHVDSAVQGTAVFWDLRRLTAGDTIMVTGDDGVVHRFVVTGAERYDDANAPLDRIFGATGGAHLNLITCDVYSPFDRHIRSYLGSLVVFADLDPA